MIKLQDFARRQGVTDRAIQKLIKKYADELEGLYQRKGPNGTWLTDEACEIIRSKMRLVPAAIIEPDGRVTELEERVKELEDKLNEKDKMLTLAQQAAQKAQDKVQELLEDADKVKRLESAQKALEGERDAYKADAEAKASKLVEEKQRHKEELTAVQEKAAADLAEKDRQIQELENRTFGDYLKGLFRKKKE